MDGPGRLFFAGPQFECAVAAILGEGLRYQGTMLKLYSICILYIGKTHIKKVFFFSGKTTKVVPSLL